MKMITDVMYRSIADIAFFLFLACCTINIKDEYAEKMHGYVWTKNEEFAESSKHITNPNSGFYTLYGFTLADESQKSWEQVTKRLQADSKELALIQINLKKYTMKPLSESALQNLDALFGQLVQYKKQYIVRFLYDWDGKNMETEPENVEIILNHMRQLEPFFHKYSKSIFIQQGVFVGNWGEMNGTKHLGNLQQLVLQLAAVTGKHTFLAVRTPAHWRTATGTDIVVEEAMARSSMVRRLGLFNDGMLGNSSDCGTYGIKSKTEAGPYSAWNREEELAFQEELCKYVPNGGEVIINNALNDFESAVQNFSTMHVTYLNIDYDRKVLNKWAETTVTEDSVFCGMDGLSYMERRLGYRLWISEADLDYDWWNDKLKVKIVMKNAGFAPLYKEPEKILTIRDKATGEERNYEVVAELRSLAGGNEKELPLTMTGKIALEDYLPGEYEVFLSIRDVDSDTYLELANEQEMQEPGYRLGEFTVDERPEILVGQ